MTVAIHSNKMNPKSGRTDKIPDKMDIFYKIIGRGTIDGGYNLLKKSLANVLNLIQFDVEHHIIFLGT